MKIKNLLTLTIALMLLFNIKAYSGVINNGDFQSCDFKHWQKDTDGSGDPGATGDFSINNNAGECSAEISVDLLDGATAFTANTLFTALDLSTTGGDLQLSFDWDFSGFDDGSLFADNFFVSLKDAAGNLFNTDGGHGYLIEPSSNYGSGSFSALLDSSFHNQSNWFLDFSVQGGWNTMTSLSSKLTIDNVTLTTSAIDVPEPSSLAILSLALIGLFSQQRHSTRRGSFL